MSFDAYYEWLGIPPADQPPNHYRLLGIAPFEATLNVIENAADRQMSHVRTFQTGPHSVRSQELLTQLASARVTLLNREKKAAYDAQLKATMPAPRPTATPVSTAMPPRGAAAPKRVENLANNNRLLMGVIGAVAVVLVLGIVITVVRGRMATAPPSIAQGAASVPKPDAPASAPTTDLPAPQETPLSPAAATVETPSEPIKPEVPSPSNAAVERLAVEDARLAPPDEAAETAAMKLIDDLFKLQQSRSAAEKLQLAQRLLATAKETNGDPAGRYVLLGLARDYAAETAEVPLVLQAIALLERAYRIDAQEMREASLTECVAGNMVKEKRLETAYAITSAAQDAAQQELFAHAGRLFGLAGEAARRAGDHQLAGKVLAPRVEQMERAQHLQEEQAVAQQTLQSSPDDAAANLLVGKYQCLVRGDWQQGLPYLARCGEAEIQAAAQADLAGAADAEAQARLGDLWWDLGEQAGDEKTYWQPRVKYWYELAEAGLSGLSRSKVEQRLKEIDPWHGFDMSEALIIGDFARLMPGKKIVTRTPRGGPLEIRLVARTDSTNIRVNGYGGSLVIWNWEVRPNELRVHHPQKAGFIGSAKVTPLEPYTWYRLRIQVGAKEVRVFTDDRLVYQRAGNNQLVVKPVSVSNAVGSVVDVRELTIEPLKSDAK